MEQIGEILEKKFGLTVDNTDEYHIYASNTIVICLVVKPHEGTKHRWMIRFSTVAAFDRWANSRAIEEFFETEDDIIKYLTENESSIYKQLLEYLSLEYEEATR